MASRLFNAGSPGAKLLASAGVNLQDMLRRNYADFADGEKIADWTYCVECTPFITFECNRQLSVGRSTLRAMAEMHVGWSTDDQEGYCHAYTAVNNPHADPTDDIIVDTTYRQFILPELRDNYPLAFVGSRMAAIAIMQRAGGDNIFEALYTPETLSTVDTAELTQDFDIPIRLRDAG